MTVSVLEQSELPAYARLRRFLKEANYDDALAVVSGWDLRTIISAPDDLSRLRFRCMISDVLDYGGRYPQAAAILRDSISREHIGEIARKQLHSVRQIGDIRDEAFAKQQCWALMLWGMTYYRLSEFESAMDRFDLARKIATFLNKSSKVKAIGTLARAWYCTGLVHREKREPNKARVAFREALELAGKGTLDRKMRNESTASFDFNTARCAGLGMGWIAYNEARLTEAASLLVMARRLMIGTKAKLIGSYLDTLQATIMMSESTKPECIQEALCLLKNAYSVLAPPNSLQHEHYALGCQNEIALAFLRLARASSGDPKQREEYLNQAETYAARVKATAKGSLKTELKTYCSALITESRVKRERDEPDDALALAKKAKQDGSDIEPIQVDACIAIGEAEQARGAYGKAIASFLEALDKGKDNRKDAAACQLHLCCAYLLDNQGAKAREHFKIWESEQAGIENAFISDLALRARKMLSIRFQEFQRTKNDLERHGKHKFHLDSLRRWLAETALALDRDDYLKAAQRLDIKVVTLKEWLKL